MYEVHFCLVIYFMLKMASLINMYMYTTRIHGTSCSRSKPKLILAYSNVLNMFIHGHFVFLSVNKGLVDDDE